MLAQLQQVLAKYAKLAAYLDDDYQRFSPLSPHFTFDLGKDLLEIDDSHKEDEANNPEDKADNLGLAKSKWSFFRGLGRGTKKITESSKKLVSLKSLPMSMQWVFQKSALQETLQEFDEWNKDLEYLIAPLLVGFGFYDENRGLQDRLRADGDENVRVNIFQGHVDLNKLANDESSDKSRDEQTTNGINEQPSSFTNNLVLTLNQIISSHARMQRPRLLSPESSSSSNNLPRHQSTPTNLAPAEQEASRVQ